MDNLFFDNWESIARKAGPASLQNIAALILETTGDRTVIGKIEGAQTDALADVKGFDQIK